MPDPDQFMATLEMISMLDGYFTREQQEQLARRRDELGPEAVDSNRALLQRWHAERNPGQQEVASMRKICPPGEETPERDVDIASRLLRDPTLYAHAVRSGSYEQAAVPRQ